MDRLRSPYLGFSLASPLVASASPLTGKLGSLRALEDCGAAAVVLPSVFEEQLRHDEAFKDHFLQANRDALSEAHSFFPDPDLYQTHPDEALTRVQEASQALDIPVIASLNGATEEGWKDFAAQLESAGANALELNLYQVSADPALSGRDIEDLHVETVRDVCASVQIPVAVKVGHTYTAFAHMAEKFEQAGGSALVLFNRFYQPNFDIETRTASRTLGLSSSRESLLPLSWIAILRGQRQLDLAATTGVHHAEDVVKLLMAGANAVCSTSALLRHGPEHLRTLNAGLVEWMDRHEYEHVEDLRGCMRREYTENPELFERANYIKLLQSGQWD